MKYVMKRLPLLLCCGGIGILQAQEVTTFAQPAQYCFNQTELRGAPDKTILEHHLLVAKEDHFKIGDVFVIARFNNSPDTIWLTDGYSWRRLNEADPIRVYHMKGRMRDPEILQPVIPISVFDAPRDVSQVEGGAQIFVGYGLREEGESSRVAFDEMVASERYDLLWRTGFGLQVGSSHICLEASAMAQGFATVDGGPAATGPETQLVPAAP